MKNLISLLVNYQMHYNETMEASNNCAHQTKEHQSDVIPAACEQD
jgi:hypothetical protein